MSSFSSSILSDPEGCNKHRNTPPHTLCCLSRSLSLSLPDSRCSQKKLEPWIWGQSLKLTECDHLRLTSMTGSHSATASGTRKWYAGDPREPAYLGAARDGLAKRFLPFKGGHFPPNFDTMTMIALAYSERLVVDHVC